MNADPKLKPDIAALKKRLSEDPGFAAQVTGELAREHLKLAIDHIAALNGALEDLASLGATIAICGTKYDDAAARAVLRPNVEVTG